MALPRDPVEEEQPEAMLDALKIPRGCDRRRRRRGGGIP